MTVIPWNPFRRRVEGCMEGKFWRIGRESEREREGERRGRDERPLSQGRAFDDVIICSNAQTLPGLIIRCPRLLGLSPFLLAFADSNRSHPCVSHFEEDGKVGR